MKEKIPEGVRVGLTTRQWKSLKRKQLRAIQKVVREYRLGCAYCPEYPARVHSMVESLEVMIESHSVKNWGR